jgi:RHS repeat-associated protein
LTDAQGGVTAQYTYDSYGVMLGQTAGAQQAQATSLLYSGERFDPALQQYYLRARHYNPANGQFTSLDPYSGSPHDPQSLHKYAYCHADPVNAVDPSGEMMMSLSDMMAGVAAWGTVLAITAPNWVHVAVSVAETVFAVVNILLILMCEDYRCTLASMGPDIAAQSIAVSILKISRLIRASAGFVSSAIASGVSVPEITGGVVTESVNGYGSLKTARVGFIMNDGMVVEFKMGINAGEVSSHREIVERCSINIATAQGYAIWPRPDGSYALRPSGEFGGSIIGHVQELAEYYGISAESIIVR